MLDGMSARPFLRPGNLEEIRGGTRRNVVPKPRKKILFFPAGDSVALERSPTITAAVDAGRLPLAKPLANRQEQTMIAKLTGRLDEAGADWAVIDVQGVGYLVHCSSKTLAALGLPGDECTVF